MASVRRRFLQSRSPPSSGRAPENRASSRPNGEQLPMLETHEDLLVRAAVESATEALQRELTATSLKLETQAEATAKAHELIQELQQELENLRLEATERAADHTIKRNPLPTLLFILYSHNTFLTVRGPAFVLFGADRGSAGIILRSKSEPVPELRL
ncbi:hypothetical protein Vretifemale_20976 [Volvox reticuliferus]|uniref:Uncharacterized protein n=1 Tax=Volvox reticuliferus TaxID=1737510 RepID=A0A8J4D284_9CHLO|nr:hypothetical protein Vretifemale_20976 [Volvox reticuliferus]